MAAALQTSTNASGTGATLSVNPPAGLASGEWWGIHASVDSSTGTIDIPAGWTAITANFGNYPKCRALYKKAGAGEVAVTLGFTGLEAGGRLAHSFRVNGQHATTPISATGTPSTPSGSATTIAVPAITVPDANSLAIAFCAMNSAVAVTPASGMTEFQDTNDNSFINLESAYQAVNAGSFSPGNITFASSDGRKAESYSIAPSASPPPPPADVSWLNPTRVEFEYLDV